MLTVIAVEQFVKPTQHIHTHSHQTRVKHQIQKHQDFVMAHVKILPHAKPPTLPIKIFVATALLVVMAMPLLVLPAVMDRVVAQILVTSVKQPTPANLDSVVIILQLVKIADLVVKPQTVDNKVIAKAPPAPQQLVVM